MAATIQCDTLQNSSSATPNITLDTSANATVAGTVIMGSSFKRNRIINGDMRVDQRNAGASGTTPGAYTVDRWAYAATQSSKGTYQQNAGSVTPPTGFTNYLGFTSSSSYSVLTGDTFYLAQPIEGYNVSDFDYGSASAKTTTLSFWARSTGLTYPATFGGSIYNTLANKSYLFSYSIPSSGTWTYITVTISGDTASATNTTTSIGLNIWLAMGSGSTYTSSTTGSWISGPYVQPTGTASVVGTNGATFYVTGVQLEVGSVATPYERQIYSDQLAQCWRYCYKLYPDSSSTNPFFFASSCTSATGALAGLTFPQRMRVVPSLTFEGALSNYGMYLTTTGGYLTVTAASINTVTTSTFGLVNLSFASGGTANVTGWLAGIAQNSFGIRWEAEL